MEELRDELRRAAKLLIDAPDVTLLGHVNPDADAFGSAVALGLALRGLGKTVRVSFGTPDSVPESLRHLDPEGLFVPAADVPTAPPVLVALDAGDLGRLGALADRAQVAEHVIVVDHHVTNTRFGTVNVVDTSAEATAVIVLALVDELGAPLTEPVARALYAGLLTDTSSFRRATPATHRAAARLLAAGVDAEATGRPLLDAHPFGWLRMLSTVLGRATLEPAAARGFGLVHTRVELADAAGVRPEDVESVVDIVRSTVEAEVAAVLKQIGPAEWSGSLRAVGRLDVSVAARELGGGGHRFAAGFTTRGTAAEVLDRLRAALDTAPLV
ncbi:MAG TPA: bifunctional oligoribonuclease/PAP phosphatase NrnA [Pseudonocardiaceae bacterium]|nr:bifunctional oligoribonuclease/PAP phosphatase NrnA [Pseudonocardiaceae bacterium]